MSRAPRMSVGPACWMACIVVGVAAGVGADPPRPSPATPLATSADLATRLMDLVARTPGFDTLGDPSSTPGRELKAGLRERDDRLAAARVVLPIALDPQQSLVRRRDAFRLMSAILGRAAGAEDLESITSNGEFVEQLQALKLAVLADSRQLLSELLADPSPGTMTEADYQEPSRGARRPDHLLPIHLITLGHLRAGSEIVGLFDEARAGMKRRAEADPAAPTIPDQLYRGTTFPLGTFVWALGLAKDEAAAGKLMMLFDEAERQQDLAALQAVLDALELVESPDESLLNRVRAIVEWKHEARAVKLPEGTDPRVVRSQAWSHVYEIMRIACIRYISLGQKRFKACGDIAWLDTVFDWITASRSEREPEELTDIRASSADLALMEITDPKLQAIFVQAALPRLGTGSNIMRDRMCRLALAAMPKPTEGTGAARRITADYADALAGQLLRSQPSTEMHIAVRACGRWGRVPALVEPVRASFTTRVGATQAFAHLVGPEARKELATLREAGPFQGQLSESERSERDRLLAMRDQARDQLQERLVRQMQAWLQADGRSADVASTRSKAYGEGVALLLSDTSIEQADTSKAYRETTLKALKTLVTETLGKEPDRFAESFDDGFAYQLSMLHDLWLMTERQFGYDWNLREALAILDISDRLASADPGVAGEGLAALRQRREDRIWEIGAFDVYAWVPELILMYEEAESRYGSSAATMRQEILSTFGGFRSTIGRAFIAEVVADPATPEDLRAKARSLGMRTITRLYDEAH